MAKNSNPASIPPTSVAIVAIGIRFERVRRKISPNLRPAESVDPPLELKAEYASQRNRPDRQAHAGAGITKKMRKVAVGLAAAKKERTP